MQRPNCQGIKSGTQRSHTYAISTYSRACHTADKSRQGETLVRSRKRPVRLPPGGNDIEGNYLKRDISQRPQVRIALSAERQLRGLSNRYKCGNGRIHQDSNRIAHEAAGPLQNNTGVSLTARVSLKLQSVVQAGSGNVVCRSVSPIYSYTVLLVEYVQPVRTKKTGIARRLLNLYVERATICHNTRRGWLIARPRYPLTIEEHDLLR